MITIITETSGDYKQSSMMIFGPEVPSKVKVELILPLDLDKTISVLSKQLHDLFAEILGEEKVKLQNFTEHGYRTRRLR